MISNTFSSIIPINQLSAENSTPDSLAFNKILDKVIIQILGGYSKDALARLEKSGLFNRQQIARIEMLTTRMNSSYLTITPLELKNRILATLNSKEPEIKTESKRICYTNWVPVSTLNQVINEAFQGYTEEAIDMLQGCGLNIKQTQKIREIFIQFFSKNFFIITTRLIINVFKSSSSIFESNSANQEFQDLKAKIVQVLDYHENSLFDLLNNDIFHHIFKSCLSIGGTANLVPLACTNKNFNDYIIKQFMPKFTFQFDIKTHCPERLSIIDAEKFMMIGIKIDNESSVNTFEVLKKFHTFDREIYKTYKNGGCTLLTMPEGLSINILMALAKKNGITVQIEDYANTLLNENARNISNKKTYRILITNKVFIYDLNFKCNQAWHDECESERNNRMARIGYKLPSIQELLALCIFQRIFYGKFLFAYDQTGDNPTTFGITSTTFVRYNHEYTLAIGGSKSGKIVIDIIAHSKFDWKRYGSGGRQKF